MFYFSSPRRNYSHERQVKDTSKHEEFIRDIHSLRWAGDML